MAIEEQDLADAAAAALLAKLKNQNLNVLNRALSIAIWTLYEVDPAQVFTQIRLDNIDTVAIPAATNDQATYDAIGNAINRILLENRTILPCSFTF